MPRLPKLKNAPLRMLPLLAVLSLSLQGCETFSPKSQPIAPTLPARPPLTVPLPSVPYSESVRQNLSRWADALTPTPPTSAPSTTLGPPMPTSRSDSTPSKPN